MRVVGSICAARLVSTEAGTRKWIIAVFRSLGGSNVAGFIRATVNQRMEMYTSREWKTVPPAKWTERAIVNVRSITEAQDG
jgi:hypothetical protein